MRKSKSSLTPLATSLATFGSFLFEPKDYFAFFAATGWQPKEVKYFAEEAQRLRRPAPFPWHVRLITSVLGIMLPPVKRRAMRQYAGFVLFGPATGHR